MDFLFGRAEESHLHSSPYGCSHGVAAAFACCLSYMAGHLDELSLSGVSIAISFTVVTGFGFLVSS